MDDLTVPYKPAVVIHEGEGEGPRFIEYVTRDVPTVSERIDDTMHLLKDFDGNIVGVLLRDIIKN